MYKRIKKTRARAQWVGFFYLLGTILLAALAFIPTLKIPYLCVIPGIREGKLLWEEWNFGLNIDTISRILYACMLLAAVVNVLRIIGHLSWLYKRKASKTYGFNRNVYAMQCMGKVFSSAFAGRLIGNMLLLLLNGTYAGTGRFDFSILNSALVSVKELSFGINVDIPVALVFMAVGVVVHLLCGFLGAKTSFFVAQSCGGMKEGRGCIEQSGMGVMEQKREISRFPALFRNILQIVVVSAIPVLLLQISNVNAFVADALAGNFKPDISTFVQIGVFLFWIVLTVHATNTTEYSVDGAQGRGMKNFKWFIFLTLIASAVLYYLHDSAFKFDMNDVTSFNIVLLVAISFVMFLVEMIMRNAPGKTDDFEDEEMDDEEAMEEKAEEDDVDWDYYFSDEFLGGRIVR